MIILRSKFLGIHYICSEKKEITVNSFAKHFLINYYFMRIILYLAALLLSSPVIGQSNLDALIPMPNKVLQLKGKPFTVKSSQTEIYTNSTELQFAAATLQGILHDRMNEKISLSSSPKAAVKLILDPTLKGKEHYKVRITAKEIAISGSTPAAVYYGIMTLDQLCLGDICRSLQKQIAPVEVDDAPRFGFRALMLDPARHFIPVNDVKFFIDQMVRYKYNVLQIHLTDDQGWRIQIKKHPKLASKDSYTQEELAELVRYAAQRHVEIIPELDIPGHTVAALAVYPELGCTHTDSLPKIVGKTTELMLCAQQEKVYSVYKDVLAEVASVFPSPFIHLGGDEAVIEKNWTQCKRCTAMMKDLGYTKASQLMIPFFERMLGFVRENGKKAVLWCELDNIRMPAKEYLFPYPKDVTLVSWRHGLTPLCLQLTKQYGNPIIMAPGEYTYLDYPQWNGDFPEFNNWGMPVTSLETSYKFDPGYGKATEEQKHILGIMGTLWAEAIQNINRVMYMTYPRGLALAEAGWTQMENRSWESFKKRMYPNITDLMQRGVSVRAPFEIAPRK